MRGREPTKGKGMRKVLRKGGYKVYLVDEFRTSCVCHNCHCRLENFMVRKSCKPRTKGQNILVHGLLGCRSVNGCGCLWNRDVNGCLNIRMLAKHLICKTESPNAFKRGG